MRGSQITFLFWGDVKIAQMAVSLYSDRKPRVWYGTSLDVLQFEIGVPEYPACNSGLLSAFPSGELGLSGYVKRIRDGAPPD